jgi:hypothetical protein
MEWARIKQYGEDDTETVWISGIYKIRTYDGVEFGAYYMKDGDKNWGWHPCHPPDKSATGFPCWLSLESAQADCERHSMMHTPKPNTIKHAIEIRDFLANGNQHEEENIHFIARSYRTAPEGRTSHGEAQG